MEKEKLIDIFNSCTSIAEICRKLYGKNNGGIHNRVIKLFNELGYDWNKRLQQINEEKKKFCLNCGKEIIGKDKIRKKFCSSSCAATYHNQFREVSDITRKRISETLKKRYNPEYEGEYEVDKFCQNCGKKLNSAHAKFCSNKCCHEYYENEYLQYIEKWKNGEECGHTPSLKIHKYVKRYLIEKYNNVCQQCGWGEVNKYTGKTPLQIHHIDGDCTNNCENNLQLLCPNCHSLTENFGSRNKNSKRVFRKQKLYHLEFVK